MVRSDLPVYIYASADVRLALGPDLTRVARLAMKAILRNRRALEVAFQQIEFGGHCLALSSRVTDKADLVIEIDMGDPLLGQRIILEDELKRAERHTRDESRKVQEARRRLRTSNYR